MCSSSLQVAGTASHHATCLCRWHRLMKRSSAWRQRKQRRQLGRSSPTCSSDRTLGLKPLSLQLSGKRLLLQGNSGALQLRPLWPLHRRLPAAASEERQQGAVDAAVAEAKREASAAAETQQSAAVAAAVGAAVAATEQKCESGAQEAQGAAVDAAVTAAKKRCNAALAYVVAAALAWAKKEWGRWLKRPRLMPVLLRSRRRKRAVAGWCRGAAGCCSCISSCGSEARVAGSSRGTAGRCGCYGGGSECRCREAHH
jgi:hypothetical protein